jgi:hypothetical protein
MKIIILLLMLVSCGKDPVKTKSAKTENFIESNPAENSGYIPIETPTGTTTGSSTESVVEMVNVKCNVQRACQADCINTFILCVEPYGGQDTTHLQMQQNPTWEAIHTKCNLDSQVCYNKIIQIPKDEYDWIMSH